MRKCPPGNSTSLNLILQLIISQHSLNWRIHWSHNLNISLIACCKTNVRREIYNSIIFFVVPSYTKTQIKWNLFCYHVSLFSVQGTGVLPNHFFRKAIFYQLTHFSLQTNYHHNRSLSVLGNNMTNAKCIRDYLLCLLIQLQHASEKIPADFSSHKQTHQVIILLSQKTCLAVQKWGVYFPLPFSVQTLSHELLVAFGASTNCWPVPSNDAVPLPLTPPFFGFVLIPSKRKTNLASSP